MLLIKELLGIAARILCLWEWGPSKGCAVGGQELKLGLPMGRRVWRKINIPIYSARSTEIFPLLNGSPRLNLFTDCPVQGVFLLVRSSCGK